jgi:hypothetical protein
MNRVMNSLFFVSYGFGITCGSIVLSLAEGISYSKWMTLAFGLVLVCYGLSIKNRKEKRK